MAVLSMTAISLLNTNFTTVQGNVISAAKTEDENLPILHEAIRLLNMSNNNTIIGNTIRGLGIKTNPNQKNTAENRSLSRTRYFHRFERAWGLENGSPEPH